MSQKAEVTHTLGIDIGATKIKVALVDANGYVFRVHQQLTQLDRSPEKIIEDIFLGIDECQGSGKREALAVGVGVAGQVDQEGIIRGAPNLKWQDVNLKAKLEEELGIPTIVVNDVRAAVWGEWRYGSGRSLSDMAMLFVGTGIGGGVVSDGKLLVGCSNTGGELGHMTIVAGGRKCHCPNLGCIEAYASGWAIAERAQEVVRSNPAAGYRLISLAGNIENITASIVSQVYDEDDPLAIRLVEETGYYLGAGAVSIVNAFNPCLLSLGGGVIEGLPVLVKIVEKVVKKSALKTACSDLKISKAILGENTVTIGAAALAQGLLGTSNVIR
jgi:glucokinase